MISFPRWKIILVVIVCLWGIYQASANFFPAATREKSKILPHSTIKLGLDLQGGSYLLLKVDFNHYLKEYFDGVLDDLRKNFRANKIGYINLGVKSGEKAENAAPYITFMLRNAEDKSKAEDEIRKISRDFDVSSQGADYSLTYSADVLKKMKKDVLEKSIEIVRRRVDETGTREPTIQMQGTDRIILQVPGLQNSDELKSLLGKTAKMTFHLMDENDPFGSASTYPPVDEELMPDNNPETGRSYLVKKKVELSGDLLTDAQATYEQAEPVVSFKFNSMGGKKFAKITSENTGRPFAVVLDGKVITAPRINTPIIGGSGIITGGFTVQEAQQLALLLRSGALPAPISIIEERSIGPSLGQDSINSGKLASGVGFALIALCMLLIYRLFGLFAVTALVVNMFLIIAVLSLFGATLTMPGIAGLVLTMGMAVDANVLIFERIKDELRNGKSTIAAIDHGFNRAFTTILDSNLTTLIAAFLLYTYGSGTVKGFAVTLSVGVLCSMFTAITLTKLFIIIWLRVKKPKTFSL